MWMAMLKAGRAALHGAYEVSIVLHMALVGWEFSHALIEGALHAAA